MAFLPKKKTREPVKSIVAGTNAISASSNAAFMAYLFTNRHEKLSPGCGVRKYRATLLS